MGRVANHLESMASLAGRRYEQGSKVALLGELCSNKLFITKPRFALHLATVPKASRYGHVLAFLYACVKEQDIKD